MRGISLAARSFLILIYVIALVAPWIAPAGYADQFRDHAGEGPSARFPLGVDDLGRDRLSRLIYGSRVSLFLAPAAAAMSVGFAFGIGLSAGLAASWLARTLELGIDLLLSLPSLFLLLIARAMLPLNTGPVFSLLLTFLMLGSLGWPAAARVVAGASRALTRSSFVLQARALGCSSPRRIAAQLLPNLRPILAAQFFVLVPVFILAEADLGILGLGVSEPLPSWGSMLAELTNPIAVWQAPWRLATPLLLLMAALSFHLAGRQEETFS